MSDATHETSGGKVSARRRPAPCPNQCRFPHDALELFGKPVPSAGLQMGHARHDENFRLVRASELFQVREQITVKRHGDFFPRLGLRVGERAFAQIHVRPCRAGVPQF